MLVSLASLLFLNLRGASKWHLTEGILASVQFSLELLDVDSACGVQVAHTHR